MPLPRRFHRSPTGDSNTPLDVSGMSDRRRNITKLDNLIDFYYRFDAQYEEDADAELEAVGILACSRRRAAFSSSCNEDRRQSADTKCAIGNLGRDARSAVG